MLAGRPQGISGLALILSLDRSGTTLGQDKGLPRSARAGVVLALVWHATVATTPEEEPWRGGLLVWGRGACNQLVQSKEGSVMQPPVGARP
jgi:hypothetical protein